MHCIAAMREDRARFLIVPVMNDLFQKVNIASGWYPGEKIARDDFAAISNQGSLEIRARHGRHSGPFQQDTMQCRVRL